MDFLAQTYGCNSEDEAENENENENDNHIDNHTSSNDKVDITEAQGKIQLICNNSNSKHKKRDNTIFCYNNNNNEEEEQAKKRMKTSLMTSFINPLPNVLLVPTPNPGPIWTTQTQCGEHVKGRYISKKERCEKTPAGQESSSSFPSAISNDVSANTMNGNGSCAELKLIIESIVMKKSRVAHDKNIKLNQKIREPNHGKQYSVTYGRNVFHSFKNIHSAGVNVIKWAPGNGYLLASGAMDRTVRIWDVFSSGKCIISMNYPVSVKCLQWNTDGRHILAGGFNKNVFLNDIETGMTINTFVQEQIVNSLAYYPEDSNMFLAGCNKGAIFCWDQRSNTCMKDFQAKVGNIQALEFITGAKEFISASDVTRRNSIDKAILVWDFQAGIVLSNQVYQEAYTINALKMHPKFNNFIAQSNGNYGAIFSSKNPFKLNKFKRFEGHQVGGYRIGLDISPDGFTVGSGSADGSLFFYDWNSTKIRRVLRAHSNVCTDVSFHPTIQGVVASCSWDGSLSIFD